MEIIAYNLTSKHVVKFTDRVFILTSEPKEAIL